MKAQEIYKLAVELGVKNDLRPKSDIQKILKRTKEKYDKLDAKKKAEFDEERLWNPYSDSRVYFDSGKKVKKIITGIDIGTGEVMLADRLGDVDLILGHHPFGKGLSNLDEVMHMQADILSQYGIPINIAESVMKPRIGEISRAVNPANVNQSIDAARLLGISIMNVHTPADNMVVSFLKKKIDAKKFDYVGEIVEFLKDIPEYKQAIEYGQGPTLFTGHDDNRCGKIALTEITGGTDGSAKMYKYLSQAGIGTIISMHQSEEHKKEAEKAHINIIIAGHISSDNIGMNLLLDEIEKKGIEIVSCSGITRIRRFRKFGR
ncbi:MAG: NGG1p interacting factor NIF3 [Candidatus Moraniibacteriota bacterium]